MSYNNSLVYLEERIARKNERVAQLEAENAKLKEDYNDLIYQVATKFPSESRHETAKRYIQQAETRPSQCSTALLGGEK